MNYPLITEISWFLGATATIFAAGWGAAWFVKGQVTRIVNALHAVPLHARQITALTLASKNAATISFFPTNPPNKKEHIQALRRFDDVLAMKPEKEEESST